MPIRHYRNTLRQRIKAIRLIIFLVGLANPNALHKPEPTTPAGRKTPSAVFAYKGRLWSKFPGGIGPVNLKDIPHHHEHPNKMKLEEYYGAELGLD